VLSGTGLCYGLITRPEESYRLWCVFVCDLETSWMRRALAYWGLLLQKQANKRTWMIKTRRELRSDPRHSFG